MKISRIAVDNFQGLRRIDVTPGGVTVVAGDNWSGKSSLQQALRLALAGQVSRVRTKGDYHMLVRDGAKQAQIQVAHDDVIADALLFSSKSKNSSGAVIPICQDPTMLNLLDQHRFSEFMDAEQRRELLFHIGRVDTQQDEAVRRLTAAKVDQAIIDEILPLLRQGFEGATDYATAKLKSLRAEWKGITGENYGSEKAEFWQAPPPDPDRWTEANNAAKEIEARAKSLDNAQKQEAEQRTVVDRLTESAHPEPETCAKCKRTVSCLDEDAQEARDALPRQQESLAALESATRTRRGSLQAAELSKTWLETVDAERTSKTERAGILHKAIDAWTKLAELVSWDGLPGEMVGKVVKAMNERLTETAAATKFPVTQIRDDMEITIGGRLWGLCSEAERWLADAAITEAIAWTSGYKCLVLDRMDVLQPFRRGAFLMWLLGIEAQGVQSIVFATLKQRLKLEGVVCFWLVDGEVVPEPPPEKEAA